MHQDGGYGFYPDSVQTFSSHGSSAAPLSNLSAPPIEASYQNTGNLQYGLPNPLYDAQLSLSDTFGALSLASQAPLASTPHQASPADALRTLPLGLHMQSSSPYVPAAPPYEQSFDQQPPSVFQAGKLVPFMKYTSIGPPFSCPALIRGPSQGYDAVVGSCVPNSHIGYDCRSRIPENVYEPESGMYDQPNCYNKPAYPQYVELYDKHGNCDYAFINRANEIEGFGVGEALAYDGGSVEPCGALSTGTSSWTAFDSFSPSTNLLKAVANVDKEERSNGVQKYRVKMLSESSDGPMDVLCQIGLEGVRMFSPTTGKMVKTYSLDSITRWEVNEPSVFTFWVKSTVDIEPRRIRLQSGSYTTNAILDALTAACVQFSEMVGKYVTRKTSTDTGKGSGLISEKKTSNFAVWMNLRNRQNIPEEKDHWVPDEAVTKCSACSTEFGPFLRRHHCRNCGDIFCDKCTLGRTALTGDEDAPVVRVCDRCLAEVTQRLSNAKQLSSKTPASRSHEDLARKLQEELDRNAPKYSVGYARGSHGKEISGQTIVFNCSACGSISLVSDGSTVCAACGLDSSSSSRRSSKGSSNSWSSQGSFESLSKRMKEVACPICTVHLQVHVPSSGTETVECEVCQHPFLVSAH